MIDERMEEQASLYAVGVLEGAEKNAFEAALRTDAELQGLVAALNAANAAMAGTVPQLQPPPGLKDKILRGIEEKSAAATGGGNIVSLDEHRSAKPQTAYFPWALAACLALMCVLLVSHDHTLKSQNENLQQVAAALQDTNRTAFVRIAELSQLAQTLQNATNDLQHTVLALQETNRIASLRIAMLGSLLSDQPKAVAVSLWDEQNQNGVFVVQNMKPLPNNKDYQLWVIDPQYKTPVDAGVFQVDEQGNVRFQFKAKSHINTANKFAVTEEDKGGSPTPKGTMVLIGG